MHDRHSDGFAGRRRSPKRSCQRARLRTGFVALLAWLTLGALGATGAWADDPRIAEVLIGGSKERIVMQPVSLRSAGFQLIHAMGNTRQLPAPDPPQTWQGYVDGEPGSTVAADFDPATASFRTVIRMPDGASYWVMLPEQPATSGSTPSATFSQRGEFDRFNLNDPLGDLRFAEVAMDTDSLFVQNVGLDLQGTLREAEALLNVVDTIFRSESGISYVLTALVVRSTEPDPYSRIPLNPSCLIGLDPSDKDYQTDLAFAEICTVFRQARDQWSGPGGDPLLVGIPRDFVQLLSDEDFTFCCGGAFDSGRLCSTTGDPISVISSRAADDQSFWAFRERFTRMAHEFGHKWGISEHCTDQTNCALMCGNDAPCPTAGVGRPSFFNEVSRALILTRKNTSSCLARGTFFVDRMSPFPWDGSSARPFPNAAIGSAATPSRGVLRFIRSGSYPTGPITLTRPMRLESTNGSALLGSQ